MGGSGGGLYLRVLSHPHPGRPRLGVRATHSHRAAEPGLEPGSGARPKPSEGPHQGSGSWGAWLPACLTLSGSCPLPWEAMPDHPGVTPQALGPPQPGSGCDSGQRPARLCERATAPALARPPASLSNTGGQKLLCLGCALTLWLWQGCGSSVSPGATWPCLCVTFQRSWKFCCAPSAP